MELKGFFRAACILSLLFALAFNSFGQKSNDFEVRDLNNAVLPFAWAGGMSAPQFSEIDLNFDGIQDLFVFDRDGDIIQTFINKGTNGQVDYEYAPEYEDKFPEMSRWALLRDYNNDSKADIFTYNRGGIKVYKNISTGGILSFQLEISPYLTSSDGSANPPSNIYVSPVDVPAIVDVDFDGDLDVLNFGLVSDQVVYYENFAIDSGDIETFKFHDNTYCWGNFREDAFTNAIILNQSCPKVKSRPKGNKHSGATVLAFDADGDQDMDLLLGDPTFNNLVFLENGGDKNFANMVSVDTAYPSSSVPVDLNIFPAGYYFDANNDGLKDLIVAPNSTNLNKNAAGVLFYKNEGSSSVADFKYQYDDFLQGDMIDIGSFAYPAFFDYNLDGLLDIVVGNGTKFDGQTSESTLYLFENTGTASNPSFKLVDEDYADVSQYNLNTSNNVPTVHIAPGFADINTDGSVDMLLGDIDGKLHYFQNEPKNGISDLVLREADFKDIFLGQYARPYIIDLNEDSFLDLVIGRKKGMMNYYENKGTFIDPDYDSIPDIDKMGNVNTTPWNEFDGYSQPCFYRASGNLYMFSGTIDGRIHQFTDIIGNLDANFTVLDTFLFDIDVGDRSHIDVADLNDDGKFDFLIGNARGGMNIYLTDLVIGLEENIPLENVWKVDVLGLGPEQFRIRNNRTGEFAVELYSAAGQRLMTEFGRDQIDLNLTNQANGVYLIRVIQNSEVQTKKIVLAR